jgi:uronate dehydrogenase
MLMHERLLITGAAGKLGRYLRLALRPFCREMVLTDIASLEPAGDGETVLQADLRDEAAIANLMEGVDAVVHLGGIIIEAPFSEILGPNIVGSYNIWEGARRAGARRIVFASSCHTVGMYRRNERLNAASPKRPDGFYGLGKAFTEDLARLYFDRHGIEAACLRIGSCLPEPINARMLATWISPEDLASLVSACLRAPYLGFTIVYGMSANAQSWWDNSSASFLGYQPRHNAEDFRDRIAANSAPPDRDDPEVIYQAGHFAAGMGQ